MKIQVNSDNTIAVDASMTRFVKCEVNRVLARFAKRLTRVEVHLSDVDKRKTGQADKRCLIEVRPAGARPLSVSAKATKWRPQSARRYVRCNGRSPHSSAGGEACSKARYVIKETGEIKNCVRKAGVGEGKERASRPRHKVLP
jgi:hypothetical protein